ncbi:MAG: hypothetical protein A2052_05545 [Deltaproteobacteria bacterium GWA2_54_12]|nr:MAG: hypothetical protein A2052_05545 [Deltaproteobacteria bacterium GWA2_54_12]
MDIHFDLKKSEGYKSLSQIARVLTEDWGRKNLYCVSCKRERLEPLRDNSQVYDYACGNCEEKYQLKSQRKPLGDKFVDSAYAPMIESIRTNKAPNLLLLHYDPVDYCAANLVVVPRFFLSTSCIEARNPLSLTARRAGWVGCNIVLKQLPPDGRIPIVHDRLAVKASEVRAKYGRFRFMMGEKSELRGWTADVLKAVRALGKKEFRLDDVYGFEGELERLHPLNAHIKPKIRQQLQLLRDRGVIKFKGNGLYKIS